MRSPRLYRVEGIILKRVDFGEADRVITIYTREHGKISTVAKGIRRTTSRMAGHLELLTHTQVQLARGRNLDVITQVATLHPYLRMREDLWRTTYAFAAAELVDRLTADQITNQPLFDLLRATLERLDADPDPELVIRLFELRALDYLGYRPQLRECVACRATLGPTSNFFSAPSGGVLCFSCGRADVAARGLTTNAFKVLRLLQADDYPLLTRVRLTDQLRRELEAITRGYLTYILERELKSSGVLAHLRQTLTNDVVDADRIANP
jgi:DNA repair protein RecO (recombination protein O)